ncbi:MAG: hypothetical protein KAU94_10310 [Verrucomicrobia bacterium]|nr:hypothetical protein [Verrucomicrobiota bacterium]
MNSIFRSYPSHPWLLEWTLEPQGCGTAFRKKNGGYFFKTMETVGRICPNLESPEWSLQVPIPQNSRINLMFNGFCGYYKHRNRACAAEIFTPEPGVLWGRFSDIPEPVLISERPAEETEGFQWLEADTIPALLAVRDGHFCLVTKTHLFNDAVQVAEDYLGRDIEAHLQAELESRTGASKLFERMTRHDALAVISAECMMRAIRPPEGAIPTRWSQSKAEGAPRLDTNEIHALALAWRQFDADTAEELFLGVLKLQNTAGAIPVAYAPHKSFSVLEAPKPILAKTAEKIWETRKNPRFLFEAIPLLRRHLQWLLHHFDPKRRGLHYWQNSQEPFAHEVYESELATVDLTVLLLTEIEALNRLREQSPDLANRDPFFSEEHDTLENNLLTQFWNEGTSQYSNAYIRSTLVQSKGFPTLTPLLWRQLPEPQRGLVLDQIRNSNSLPGGHSVLSWRTMVPGGHEFPLLQQMLLLEILETHDSDGPITRDFTRLMLQEFTEWHTRSIEEHGTLELDPAMAGFIITLMETHHYRDYSKEALPGFLSKISRKTRFNRIDAAIIAATLFAAWTTRTIYSLRRQPPPFTVLDAQINSAYASKNMEEALQSGLLIINYYPEQAGLARLLVGNILMSNNKPGEAEPFFRDVRKEFPDSPGPMISHGLAYQLLGRFKEADEVYGEFTYLFDEIFPDLVNQIQEYRYLMEEDLQSPPPKWIEIYRYRLMHEL